MRVAFVTNVVYPFVTGGAQKRVHEIGTRLADRGHDVTVYGRHFWDGPRELENEGMTLRAAAPAAELYAEERRSVTEAVDFAARLVPTLRRHLRRDEHDVVVASVFPYFPILACEVASLGTGVPLVTTWHEVWRAYWEDYLGPLAVGGKLTERLTARVPQHPVAVSGVTADRLAGLGPARDRVEVVPNGIDVEQVRNAPLPSGDAGPGGGGAGGGGAGASGTGGDGTSGGDTGDGRFDVLFAGRLIAEKNVDLLLDAFDHVAGAHDATLGVVGDGPELDRLRHRAGALDHADRVTFLGFLDDYEDVLGHMRAARVFASPSTREGFGITYAEAMAADCTVIGVDHPDSAADEVIGRAGYLPEPTLPAVRDALDRALSGDRPPVSPSDRARQFDWDAVTEDAEAAYRRACAGTWSG